MDVAPSAADGDSWLASVPLDLGATPQDESAALREALAIIGDLDLSGDPDSDDGDALSQLLGFTVEAPAQPESDRMDVADVEAPSAPKTNCMKKQARSRRREELTYLRGLVGELEERLVTVQKRAADEKAERERVKTEDKKESEMTVVLTAAWEKIARRQQDRRQKAEEENAKLRRMLEEQIRVGKSLERLLTRKRGSLEHAMEEPKKLRRSTSMNRSWSRAQIFEELIASIPALYEQVPTVERLLPRGAAKNDRRVELLPHTEFGVVLLTREYRLLPFPYELTAEVVWKSLPEFAGRDAVHLYGDDDGDEDTMRLQASMIAELASTRATLNVKIASRRYAEPERTTIVTAGVVDPSDISNVKMDGIYLRQHVWHFVEPYFEREDPRVPAGTVLRSYFYGTPDIDAGVSDRLKKVGTLTNFLLSSISAEIDLRHQALADRLQRKTAAKE